MGKTTGKVGNILYKIFTAVEFTAVISMAVIFITTGVFA